MNSIASYNHNSMKQQICLSFAKVVLFYKTIFLVYICDLVYKKEALVTSFKAYPFFYQNQTKKCLFRIIPPLSRPGYIFIYL